METIFAAITSQSFHVGFAKTLSGITASGSSIGSLSIATAFGTIGVKLVSVLALFALSSSDKGFAIALTGCLVTDHVR